MKRVWTVLSDFVLLIGIVWLLPIAILLLGLPIGGIVKLSAAVATIVGRGT